MISPLGVSSKPAPGTNGWFCVDLGSGKDILSIAIYYCGDGLPRDIKALSPVIAAVILVAAAVAVSLSAAFGRVG